MKRLTNNRLGAKTSGEWLPANHNFYAGFRRWLRDGGYGDSALALYSVAARLALGYIDKAYWLIDPDDDIERVRQAIRECYDSEGTRAAYFKGLAKFAEYVRYRCHRPAPPKQVNWPHFLDPLPEWLAKDVRSYVAHRQRTWLPDTLPRAASCLLSRLTLSLRWMAAGNRLGCFQDLTPGLWWEYLDHRLANGINPSTTNGELTEVQQFLRYLAAEGRPVCQRMEQVERLSVNRGLPRDVPLDQLRILLDEIEAEAASTHGGKRRMGQMDRAWFLLMLHSGLRSGEVRRSLLPDLDLVAKQVRIEQSKGLKDRIVHLSAATVAALDVYLEVRGPSATEHVFLYSHRPLSVTYFSQRLKTYSRRCGVLVNAHQLRHSCATLLLNAGAPVLTVQAILGHKHIDTTLSYARLYDGTVAADYYRAMSEVEKRFSGSEDTATTPDCGQMLALVDALHAGTLNDAQRDTLHALRSGILTTFGSLSGGLADNGNNAGPDGVLQREKPPL